MDESFDKKPSGTFAVGGIIGKGVPIFELERGWDKLLSRNGLKYFKASDCQNATGEFAKFVVDPQNRTKEEQLKLDSISHSFLSLICNPVPYDKRNFLVVHGVGIIQPDFYEVIKDVKAKAVLGPSPYRLAYDFAMIQCAWTMKELGDGQPANCASFVCDEDQEHRDVVEPAFHRLKETNPTAAEYMATFTTGDEKKCLALQAADAAVYEVRRALNLSLKLFEGTIRKQFHALADESIVFLVTHANKEQLEWIAANHKPGEPFKLDELMNSQLKENIDHLRA